MFEVFPIDCLHIELVFLHIYVAMWHIYSTKQMHIKAWTCFGEHNTYFVTLKTLIGEKQTLVTWDEMYPLIIIL